MTDNVIELIVKTTDNASAQIKSIAAQLGELGKVGDSLQNVFGAIFAGFSAEKLVESITEAQTATNDLNRAFAAFGGAVGIGRDNMDEFADSVSKSTTFTESALKEAQATLLQYTSITGQSFEQARDLVVDLAAKMGVDASQAAELLGRSLQNPISGIRLLAQAGVTLTQQQRQVIQSLVEEGDGANVLAFQLAQLSIHTKGAASDLANTLGGALTQLKNSFAQAFEGKGANVDALTNSIKALSAQVQDPKFQQGIQTIVGGVVTLGAAAANAALWMANLAKSAGEGIAHLIGSADTPLGQLQDTQKGLQDLIAGNTDPAAANGLQQQLDAVTAKINAIKSAADAATKSAQYLLDSAYLDTPVKANSLAVKIPVLDTPIGEARNGQTVIDLNKALFGNTSMAPALAAQFKQDVQDPLDKQFDDLQAHIAQRGALVQAGLLDSSVSDAQTKEETLKYLDNFNAVDTSARHIKTSLDDIQKEGEQVAQSLTSGFETFFESGDLSAHNFLQTMLRTFDQIFAKAASQDIVSLLGLNKLFDQPGAGGSQVGGLLGALGALFGGNSSSVPSGAFLNSNQNNDELSGFLESGALATFFKFAAGGGQISGPTIVGEDGPELFVPGASGTVMNQRQLAFAGGGGGQGLVYAPVHQISLVTDNSDKNAAALATYLTAQNAQDKKEFTRLLARNGIKLRQ